MLLRKAWLDAKAGYIQDRGAPSRATLMTYQKARYQRDNLRNYMRKQSGQKMIAKGEDGQLIDVNHVDLDWVDDSLINLKNYNSCNSALYELEKLMKLTYLEELELIIQF